MIQVTQENVHIFMPHKVSKICGEVCKKKNIGEKAALVQFYKSKTAAALHNEMSKLWQLGWTSLYEMYEEEDD